MLTWASQLLTDLHTSPPPPPTGGGNVKLELNSADLVDHYLVSVDHPVSDTKLPLLLQVCYISSHLASDTLFSVNLRVIMGTPKSSLLLEAKSMPALIIKPRLILAVHMDDLGWYIKFNQH